MTELQDWAKRLYDLNEEAIQLCDALLMRDMEEDKNWGGWLLPEPIWRQVKEYKDKLEAALRTSDIQNLLARIAEGEE